MLVSNATLVWVVSTCKCISGNASCGAPPHGRKEGKKEGLHSIPTLKAEEGKRPEGGHHLQVEVFKAMVSLRALHLDKVTLVLLNRGYGGIEALLCRLRPLTNLEEMSVTLGKAKRYLADLAEVCCFWQRRSDVMAQDMFSLRQVDVIPDESRSTFKLR